MENQEDPPTLPVVIMEKFLIFLQDCTDLLSPVLLYYSVFEAINDIILFTIPFLWQIFVTITYYEKSFQRMVGIDGVLGSSAQTYLMYVLCMQEVPRLKNLQ